MMIRYCNFCRVFLILMFVVAQALMGMSPVWAEAGPSTRAYAPLTKFSPGKLWLDTAGKPINAHGGGVLFWEGTYYWYGESKLTTKPKNLHTGPPAEGIRCYTSKDLINWEDKGLVLSVVYDNPKSEMTYGSILERPKVVYNSRTNQFYAYFRLIPPGKGYSIGYTGIALAKSPLGPFQYVHRVLCMDERGSGDFFLHVDDSGDLYQMAPRHQDHAMCLAKYSEEYLQPASNIDVLQGITPKTEAPAGFFKDGKFYLLGSGMNHYWPTPPRLFMANDIHGPYQDLGNPLSGVNPNNGLGKDKTFGGQSTFVIKVQGKKDAYIAMFDVWNPEAPNESKYIWLPIEFEAGKPVVKWRDEWDLSVFDNP